MSTESAAQAGPDRQPDTTAQRAEPTWWVYRGTGRPVEPGERDGRWPSPPPWRDFNGGPDVAVPAVDAADMHRRLGVVDVDRSPDTEEVSMVNAAIYLRRPLLITGRPGVGKSSLAYLIARELGLGRVLHWPVTSRTTLRSGLYDYDAIGRVQSTNRAEPDLAGIGDFIHLGPLGTALLPSARPRVLLVDEMDKSDVDLPNDLLNIFEDGEFTVPELLRVRSKAPSVLVHTADPGGSATIVAGQVRCHEFPVVIITSNGEKEFPAPFLRRCLRWEIPDPNQQKLADMVAAHFPDRDREGVKQLIRSFVERRGDEGALAADQLLNAVHLATSNAISMTNPESLDGLLAAVWRSLSAAPQ